MGLVAYISVKPFSSCHSLDYRLLDYSSETLGLTKGIHGLLYILLGLFYPADAMLVPTSRWQANTVPRSTLDSEEQRNAGAYFVPFTFCPMKTGQK